MQFKLVGVFLVLALCAVSGLAQTVLNRWDQCGGLGGNCRSHSCLDAPFPQTVCEHGTVCQKLTQLFYQCVTPIDGQLFRSTSISSTKNGNSFAEPNVAATGATLGRPASSKITNTPTYTDYSSATLDSIEPRASTCKQKAGKWDICGGISSTARANTSDPNVCCDAGLQCTHHSEWYWSCQPRGQASQYTREGDLTLPTTSQNQITAEPTRSSLTFLKKFDQCGGMGGTCKLYDSCADAPFRGITCPAATACKRVNNWYYQCVPTLFVVSDTKR